MIREPTVLILGAGASMPYEFPSGERLREMICNMSTPNDVHHNLLVDDFRVDTNELRAFAQEFFRSSVASIDAFLARRQEFTRIGKLCIAVLLCGMENPNHVIARRPDDWYYYVWNVLIQDAYSKEEFTNNRLRIVTFNYDRSLEYFLHTSIRHTYHLNNEEALDVLKEVAILHVYGSLGEYHHVGDGKTARPFSHEIHRTDVSIAANSIKVIPEARDADPFMIAQRWCYEANRIGFLGFGFDELNIQRLQLREVLDSRRKDKHDRPEVVASIYHKTPAEGNHYHVLVAPSNPWKAFDEKCTMTLRHSGLLLTAPNGKIYGA